MGHHQIRIVEVQVGEIGGENQGPNVLQSLPSLTNSIFLAQAKIVNNKCLPLKLLKLSNTLCINVCDQYILIILIYQ